MEKFIVLSIFYRIVSIYKGKPSDIFNLQKKITKLDISQGFFVPVTEIRKIFKKSPIEHQYSIIETYFLHAKQQKVNIMEVIACLIVYSSCTLEEKIQIAVDVFDFDNNHVITKDEMIIMCISFIRGIGIATQAALYNKQYVEELSNQAFYLADSNPDGMITYEEYYLFRLIEWIKGNQVLTILFTKTHPRVMHSKRKSLMESHGFELKDVHCPGTFDRRHRIRTASEPKKTQYKIPINSSIEYTQNILHEHYQKLLQAKGRVIVKDLHDALNHHILYKNISEKIAKSFKYRQHSEIT